MEAVGIEPRSLDLWLWRGRGRQYARCVSKPETTVGADQADLVVVDGPGLAFPFTGKVLALEGYSEGGHRNAFN